MRDDLPQAAAQSLTVRRPQTHEAGDIETRLPEYRARVTEASKAMLAVIGAHAARTDAAEGQLLRQHVREHVVDGDATGGGPCDELGLLARIVAEVVERERPLASVDGRDDLLEAIVRTYGKQRGEDPLRP